MATLEQSTARVAYTTQALATLGADPTWDAALTDYLRKDALQWADYEFGAMSADREESNWMAITLTDKYGKNWRKNPEAEAEWAPVFAKGGDAEDIYCKTYSEPHWEASLTLMKTPAPTLAAALFKIAMIEREELDRENAQRGHCMAFVLEDMARLAGGQA